MGKLFPRERKVSSLKNREFHEIFTNAQLSCPWHCSVPASDRQCALTQKFSLISDTNGHYYPLLWV